MRAVTRVVRGTPTSDGAGVRLTRVIGGQELPDLDPFLELAHLRPMLIESLLLADDVLLGIGSILECTLKLTLGLRHGTFDRLLTLGQPLGLRGPQLQVLIVLFDLAADPSHLLFVRIETLGQHIQATAFLYDFCYG